MIAAAFMGCTGPAFGSSSADTNGNGLRDDVELEILKFVSNKKKVDPDNYIIMCYGTYNDSIVLKVWEKKGHYVGAADSENVAGFEFWISNGRRLQVWHIDKLYYLQEAYESGILTVDDIETIYNIHSGK